MIEFISMNLFEKFFERQQFKESQENKETYHFEAFQSFEPSFIKLVKKLKNEIDGGRYDVLVSDDVGGRLPTLAIRKIIEARRGRAPKTIFLSKTTAGEDIQKNHQSHIEKFRQSYRDIGRALLVTEWAGSGGSLRELLGLLDGKGIIADIAVPISLHRPKDLLKVIFGESGQNHTSHNHKLFVAESKKHAPRIDSRSQELTGVERARAGTFPEIKRIYAGGHLDEQQESIKKAREDVDLLVKRSLKRIWKA